MTTVEELQQQNSELKEKMKLFVAKLKDDHQKELAATQAQFQVKQLSLLSLLLSSHFDLLG